MLSVKAVLYVTLKVKLHVNKKKRIVKFAVTCNEIFNNEVIMSLKLPHYSRGNKNGVFLILQTQLLTGFHGCCITHSLNCKESLQVLQGATAIFNFKANVKTVFVVKGTEPSNTTSHNMPCDVILACTVLIFNNPTVTEKHYKSDQLIS